jgi:glycerophosphoryl diester phosphodiesterase
MVECDVQITSDGQAVVFHDGDLQRLGGRTELVANCTAAQMKEWVGAPLLSELLNDSECPQFVNIELKTAQAFGGNRLERAVLAAVETANAQSRILLSSFNPFALRRMAKLAPQLPRALLVTEEKDKANKMYLKRMWLGAYCRAHMINVDKDMVTAVNLDAWAERGLRAATWTVNAPDQAREFLAMGAVSVISDTIFADDGSV